MADLDPQGDAAIWLQQGLSLHQDGKQAEAERLYRRVLVADPGNPDALNLLAVCHHERGDRDLAISMLRRAIKISTESGKYWNNLGLLLGAVGDRMGAIAALRQAAAHDRDPNAEQALIFAMDLHPYANAQTRMADRRAFNARYCAALTAQAAPHPNDRALDRRLVVGYVGGDFRSHSAAMCFGPVLLGHDHAAVEVIVYSTSDPSGHDRVTAKLKTIVSLWHDVHELDDAALADLIRVDGVDILVDLSGYSGGNRLLTFARKPAPVQITAWGHATGTGLDAMDYLLADPIAIPPEHAPLYREQVLRLPCLLAYDPGGEYPPVCPPPSELSGAITFGYLGRANKTSERVWAVWAEILHRVPGSRLLLKADDYTDATYRARVADFFVASRIGSARLAFLPASDHDHHLATYAEVDVALDAFPQCGGITTIEACLMGVPSVTLLGDFVNGRASASVLHAIGRPETVARDTSAYVDLAVTAALTHRTLGDRLALRDRLLGSILCDPFGYAHAAEALYRQAWKAYVATVTPPGITDTGIVNLNGTILAARR